MFYQRYQDDPLVIDKWFTVQATSCRPDTLEQVRALMRHPAFTLKNPNRVRSLIGAFAHGNPARFHDPSGGGYRFSRRPGAWNSTRSTRRSRRGWSAPLSRWRRYDDWPSTADACPAGTNSSAAGAVAGCGGRSLRKAW